MFLKPTDISFDVPLVLVPNCTLSVYVVVTSLLELSYNLKGCVFVNVVFGS